MPRPLLRILAIEDDPDRMKMFMKWAPADVKFVWAKSGGQARGVIDRDRGAVYQGIILDHDLDKNPRNESDTAIDGTQLTRDIVEKMRPMPVLIHSMNPHHVPSMATRLSRKGFTALVVPFADLTEDQFVEWVDWVREDDDARDR